jgi:hypothetical protein
MYREISGTVATLQGNKIHVHRPTALSMNGRNSCPEIDSEQNRDNAEGNNCQVFHGRDDITAA